jgi:rhodanese-related sulfurtransferase
MLKDFLKKAAKTGLGIARFAAMEVKERFADNAPNIIQPQNPTTEDADFHDGSLPLVGEMSAIKMHRALESDSPPVMLDCREIYEWEAGYIDGSVHIPMNDLPKRCSELDPKARTVVICLHGMRSAEVASWLKHKQGFSDVRSLEGGIVSWYSDFDQERIIVLRSEDR